MRTRVSPEQIIQSQIWEGRARGDAARDAMRAIEAHGYVIVHPDDVAPADRNHPGWDHNGTWGEGWNACRAHIFGDDQ